MFSQYCSAKPNGHNLYAYFTSKQIRPSGFERQNTGYIIVYSEKTEGTYSGHIHVSVNTHSISTANKFWAVVGYIEAIHVSRKDRTDRIHSKLIRLTNVVLRLGQRHRRWTSSKTTMVQRLVSAWSQRPAKYTYKYLYTTLIPKRFKRTPRLS